MNALRSWATGARAALGARAVLAILVVLLVGLLAVFVVVGIFTPGFVVVGVFDPAWVYAFFGVQGGTEKFRILEFVGVGMGGVLLAIGATIANRRAVAMEETAKQQAAANRGAEDGRRQERLKNAIEHLGHESDSVRLGGAYELFHLARDSGELRQTAMDILCAHIRRTTGETEYREKYEAKPSEEVQSLLTLLFVEEHEVFKDCGIHLRGSWLNGTILNRARLQGASLSGARLQGASLLGAQLQGADLREAQLQGADLSEAQLQGADLLGAQLQGVVLYEAELQGADLSWAQLQGADLDGAQLQGVVLYEAELQGADLSGAQLQGATRNFAGKLSFDERIHAGIGRENDLSGATFAGGLNRKNVDSFVEAFTDERAQSLRQKLEPHIDRPPSHELPEGSGAIVGTYTREEAEPWIAEYSEAVGESPEADTG